MGNLDPETNIGILVSMAGAAVYFFMRNRRMKQILDAPETETLKEDLAHSDAYLRRAVDWSALGHRG